MVLPLAFSRYEMHVGRETNSPSLIADAQEYRVHVFSSGVVLLAFLSQMGGLQVDRWAALVVVMFVAKMGWDLLVDGMRVLLDASLDSETMARVRRILEEEPLVAVVRSLTGRNAGRYRFIESEITLRTRDLEIAHLASDRLETRIRAAVPNVDRVLIHYDPALRTHLRCGVPLESPAGRVSEHFGEAPYFAVLTIRTADGVLERQDIHANPFVHVPKAKGIRVAEWLVENRTDVVFTKEVMKGRGPEYMLGSRGVELCLTTASRLEDVVPAVRELLKGISL
jgi:predicted Fe-Mo cluster-binding NifX family protein